MKANILAEASFLQQIPNLAYAYTGPNPPPNTNLAIGVGGENPGVLGKKQTNLITSFFHATPKRDRPPDTLATHEESLHSNKGGEGTAASPLPTNLTKLVRHQNCPSQAEQLPPPPPLQRVRLGSSRDSPHLGRATCVDADHCLPPQHHRWETRCTG